MCPEHRSTDGEPEIEEQWISPVTVVSVRFQGVRNVPSRIWMVRDWIRRHGCRAVGAPSCLFSSPGDANTTCEVQWAVEGAAPRSDGEVCVKKLPAFRVVCAHARGGEPLAEVLAALRAAAAARGYAIGGPHREVYHLGEDATWAVEVQLPIAGTLAEAQAALHDDGLRAAGALPSVP